MMNKKIFLILLVILIFAAFLRIYRITEMAPGVNQDEASIGYTAYSLLKTGSDGYGRLLLSVLLLLHRHILYMLEAIFSLHFYLLEFFFCSDHPYSITNIHYMA